VTVEVTAVTVCGGVAVTVVVSGEAVIVSGGAVTVTGSAVTVVMSGDRVDVGSVAGKLSVDALVLGPCAKVVASCAFNRSATTGVSLVSGCNHMPRTWEIVRH
jgi:hypothetical protein